MPESFFFPVYSGLISPDHKENIGPALWEFLWLISKTTKEEVEDDETWGIVLGGKPIKICEISNDLGGSERTAKRNIARLKEFGYIETKRAPYGEIYRVKKSKKFINKRGAKNGTSENKRSAKSVISEQREVPHLSKRSAKSVISNKDIKDIKIKEDIKTTVGVDEMSNSEINNPSPRDQIKNKYLRRRAKGFDLSPKDEKSIERLLKDDIPLEKILTWIDEIFDNYEPKHRMDEIKNFKYVEAAILGKWANSQDVRKQKANNIDWENL
ncbi:winged helix-turn-helix domain-containing protein (plasmid) [Cytobacillus spongiae]|uniref:winged helix-turn-helix domain-containing protein n=1 Tax=Cytobacillus spongiae TaxID=2901381 RepID=UPI001F35B732|nr:winged helix-turn-helix domain-containing protein [Cytobacillus spongiae]UII58100.1 winged helix-turn-helix domain-containing protein [Cytobacillus spongiae]